MVKSHNNWKLKSHNNLDYSKRLFANIFKSLLHYKGYENKNVCQCINSVIYVKNTFEMLLSTLYSKMSSYTYIRIFLNIYKFVFDSLLKLF